MKVSVVVLTYNHEKYLEKAIQSILNQDVDFEYEVLIGNDKSPDNTELILQKYSQNPRVKIYNREINLGATKNLLDLLKRSSGEYIAFLEGDDYWTDKNKLKKQVQVLDKNKDYSLCMSESYTVDENNSVIGEKKIEVSEINGVKELYFYRSGIPTGTILFRNIFFKTDEKLESLITASNIIGDLSLFSYLITKGKFYNLKEKMGAYRFITNSGTSYSAMNTYKQDLELEKVVKKVLEVVDEEKEFLELYLNRIRVKLLKNSKSYLKTLNWNERIELIKYIFFMPYYNLKYSNIKKEMRKNEKDR
ncbi:MAG: glycosyltransferase family 2 protein [Cetobacterium sp.]